MKTKSNFFRALSIGALTLASALMAHAAPALKMSDGTVTLLVEDDGPLDASTVPGVVVYSGPVGSNWYLNVNTGLTKPILGSSTDPSMDLNVSDYSNGPGTITIQFSDDSFGSASGLLSGVVTTQIGGTINGGAGSILTNTTSVSDTNTRFAGSALTPTNGPFSSATYNGTTSGNLVLSGFFAITQTIVITHTAGGSSAGDAALTFAAAPPPLLGKIGNFVWNDLNNNGVQDSGEPGIGGILVTLNGPGGVQTIPTDGSGLYQFINLAAGTYTVTVGSAPAGFLPTLSGQGTPATDSNPSPVTVILAAGESNQTIDFGVYQPATIGDKVFNDLNGNGVQDGGLEVGVNGVKVELFTCVGNVLNGTTLTSGGGLYSFTVPAGDYYVKFSILPAGFVFSPSTASTVSDATDSDADPVTGKTDCTALAPGETDITWDAGIYLPVQAPCLEMTKTANKTTVAPYEPVTYTYLVHNCGNTTLTNIVVTDDNGTPKTASDDFTVGTIASLAPGASATLTAQVIPVVSTVGVVNGNTLPAGAIIVVVPQANGDIKVTYVQDFGINDNTYGTGCVGWPGSNHTFNHLVGSDKLEFRFFDKNGNVAIDFYVDCISAGASVTIPGTGQVINYPSGYGTKGPFGGDGSMVAGNPNNIVSFSTSITENLNNPLNLPNKAALIVNSPTSLVAGNVVIDPLKAPGGWNHINTYSVVIKASTFGAVGFGSVAVPDQHNSPNKPGGPNGMATTVVNSTVINTAKAKAGTLTAIATATVNIVVSPPLPNPWQTADIGAVAATGSATGSGSSFTVVGSGADISGSKDEFRYVYQTASGDCTMVARVLTVSNSNSAAKAGVMIRDNLTDGSSEASITVTPGSGIIFSTRTSTGGSTSTVTKSGLTAPYWVKVQRVGSTFTASYSPNGTTWTVLGTKTIMMGASPYIGLSVTSKKDGTLCTSTFDNVTATP